MCLVAQCAQSDNSPAKFAIFFARYHVTVVPDCLRFNQASLRQAETTLRLGTYPFSSDQGSQTGLGSTSTRLSDRPGTLSAVVFSTSPETACHGNLERCNTCHFPRKELRAMVETQSRGSIVQERPCTSSRLARAMKLTPAHGPWASSTSA